MGVSVGSLIYKAPGIYESAGVWDMINPYNPI